MAAQKLSGTIRELGERKGGGKRLSGKNIYSQTPDRGAKRGRKVIRLLYPAAKRALRILFDLSKPKGWLLINRQKNP